MTKACQLYAVTIRMNKVPRDLIDWRDLTTKERENFDYIDNPEESGNARFFRYRGWVYNINEFMSVARMSELAGWDGYSSDSYFSGVLIRLVDDCERVVVATYYS